jgi:hypothetical protein
MGRQFVRGETLSMCRQKKSGVPFDIPILPSLREELDLQPQTDRHLTFLVTEARQAVHRGWIRKLVSRPVRRGWTSEVRGARSSLRGCDAAGRIWSDGAHQLMAWFGWRTLSEADRYTQEANRKRLAASAEELISGTGIGKPETQFAKTSSNPFEITKGEPHCSNDCADCNVTGAPKAGQSFRSNSRSQVESQTVRRRPAIKP